MKQNRQAILYACIAVLSWSTVATAFKKSLEHITHFELVLVSCVTSLLIFTILMSIQKKWHLIKGLSLKEWGYFALAFANVLMMVNNDSSVLRSISLSRSVGESAA